MCVFDVCVPVRVCMSVLSSLRRLVIIVPLYIFYPKVAINSSVTF